jgi:hypothetical protein
MAVIIDLMNTCHVGRIGTVGSDGYPMVKPLNLVYTGGTFYFHSEKEGEKIEDIKKDSRVCFEANLPIAFVRGSEYPRRAGYLHRSIKGRAHPIEDRDEQISGLTCLMQKYQPEGGYGDFPEEKLKITGVVRIDIEEITGKENLGKEGIREEAMKALAGTSALPVVIG